jgi:RNA recognition motif-containing protein
MQNETATTSLTKLYVGSLPYSWTAEQLEELFKTYGRITSAAIVSDQVTRRSKGFGFIEFEAEESARKAMEELNGREIEGRNLSVREARPHVERSFSGGGGGGGREMRDRPVQSYNNEDSTDTTGRSYGNRRGWW